MNLWITGSDGLVGSHLRQKATLATSRRDVDISDIDSLRLFVKSQTGITHIVNCAGFTRVDLAKTDRDEMIRSNVIGPANLGKIAADIKAHLVHLSSDYVFSGKLQRPLKEDDPVDPCNEYGMSKLEGEKQLQEVFPKACIIRTSWIFGSGGKNFAARLLQMCQNEKDIFLTNDQRSRPTYVVDLAKAILNTLECSGLFHFANGDDATKYEFGIAIQKEAEAIGLPLFTSKIIPVSSSQFISLAPRPIYSVLDTSKIETVLKTKIRPWRAALRDYLWTVF